MEYKGRRVTDGDLKITNNIQPKPIQKSSMVPPNRPTISKEQQRLVKFDSDVSFISNNIEDDTPADDRFAWNEHETRKMVNEGQIAGLELLKDDMKNMDSKAKKFAKKTLYKLEKERELKPK